MLVFHSSIFLATCLATLKKKSIANCRSQFWAATCNDFKTILAIVADRRTEFYFTQSLQAQKSYKLKKEHASRCDLLDNSSRNTIETNISKKIAMCSTKTALLVSRIKNRLSSFELGFLNIFLHQNVLRSLSLILFLLQRYKYGAKRCPKNHVRFDF